MRSKRLHPTVIALVGSQTATAADHAKTIASLLGLAFLKLANCFVMAAPLSVLLSPKRRSNGAEIDRYLAKIQLAHMGANRDLLPAFG
jgi:hypothetical protein